MMPQYTPAAALPRQIPEPDVRQRVRDLLDNTVRHCHHATRAVTALAEAGARQAAAAGERITLPAHAGLHALLAVLVLAAAGAFEMMISGSVLEYFAGRQLHLSASAKESVRWLAPWLVLALEVALSIRITHERRERLPGAERPTPSMRWAVLMVAGLLGMTLTTRIARWPEDPRGQEAARFWVETATLLLLTGVAHAIVLSSGHMFETAWNFAGWRMRVGSAASAAQRERADLGSAQQAARASFELYYHERDEYNRRHAAHAIPPGPFDAVTCRVLNEIYGREMVSMGVTGEPATGVTPAPAGSPATPEPAARPVIPIPAPAPDSAEDGYLRHALDAMVRNRDGELSP